MRFLLKMTKVEKDRYKMKVEMPSFYLAFTYSLGIFRTKKKSQSFHQKQPLGPSYVSSLILCMCVFLMRIINLLMDYNPFRFVMQIQLIY